MLAFLSFVSCFPKSIHMDLFLIWLGKEADNRKNRWMNLITGLESESEFFPKKQLKYRYMSHSARSAITYTIYSSIFF